MTIAVISMIRDTWGGSEELWYQMAKAALQRGHMVIHLRYENPDIHPKMQELIDKGMLAYTRPGWIPATVSEFKKFGYLLYNFARKKIKDPFSQVFQHNPDIVLYNGTCYSIKREQFLLQKLSQHKNVTFFLLGHLNHDLIREISDSEAVIIRQAYQRSQNVFFVSNRSLSTAERHLSCSIPNAEIIRNPVNLPSTGIVEFPEDLIKVNFAIVANLVAEHKGHDLLLKALSLAIWKKRNWVLNIYGEGRDKAYLQSLTRFFGLEEKVIFHGKTNDIRSVWKQNHALILPSLMEGMPLAVVEAMLCGRVCIVTDVGGNSEWIDDQVNGFLIPAPAVKLLQETLELAWQQKNLWKAMGEKARQKAMLLYEPEAGKKLLTLITEHE